MFDAAKLWRDRLGVASKEIGQYARYIFNGHIVIVLVFLLGTASFYYQQWVQSLEADFPVAFLMAVVLALVVTYSPIFTFLLDADKVFLLPLEEQLAPYFKRSIILSFIVGVYLLTVCLAIFMPIYAQVTGAGFGRFLPFLLIIAVLKFWNLVIRWKVLHFVERSTHQIDTLIRYVVNGVFLYFVFANASIWLVAIVGLMEILLFVAYTAQTKTKGLKWETLIQLEEKRMMSFYRLANMFTDVPKLKDTAKRRRWLDFIVSALPYRQNAAFLHLFVQTFLRGGDYLGLWIRLSVIGGIVLYFVTYGYGQVLLVVLVLYLTGFQLLPLWNHHQNKLWIRLYPVNEASKRDSFQRLLFQVLLLQSIVLSLAILLKSEWLVSAMSVVAGMLFSYGYVYLYMRKKLT